MEHVHIYRWMSGQGSPFLRPGRSMHRVDRFAAWLIELTIHEKYALALSLAIIAWVAYCTARQAVRYLSRAYNFALWWAFQSSVPRPVASLDLSSYGQAISIAGLWALNVVILAFQARSWTHVQRRAGCLAVVHLLPLCTGFSFSFPAQVCHIERQTFEWLHRWSGRLCVFHCLVHATMILKVIKQTAHISAAVVVPVLVSLRTLHHR